MGKVFQTLAFLLPNCVFRAQANLVFNLRYLHEVDHRITFVLRVFRVVHELKAKQLA